ncbi:MAG: hypothetical protein D6797_03505, partial [Bdellovibrio sp.]
MPLLIRTCFLWFFIVCAPLWAKEDFGQPLRQLLNKNCLLGALSSEDALTKNKGSSVVDSLSKEIRSLHQNAQYTSKKGVFNSFFNSENFKSSKEAIRKGYDLRFSSPTCQSSPLSLVEGLDNDSEDTNCNKYISYRHKQVHLFPKKKKTSFLTFLNTYTSHVRSPQNKGIGDSKDDIGKWTYYDVSSFKEGKFKTLSWKDKEYS